MTTEVEGPISTLPSYEELKSKWQKPDKHFCEICVEYYDKFNFEQRQKDKNWIDSYPSCNGSREELDISYAEYIEAHELEDTQESREEYEYLKIQNNIVLWAAAELGITTEGEKVDFEGDVQSLDRWYQSSMLLCSSQFKAYRCGRRLGKSFSMETEAAYFLCTQPGYKVLLICPYEKQVVEFMTTLDAMLKGSSTYSTKYKYNKSKHFMVFDGGSRIQTIMTGGDKAGGGSKARGQPADLLVFDETEYMSQADIEAAIAILADNPKARIIAGSTPSGKRSYFYSICTDKKRRYKEFHYATHASPSFTKIADDEIRAASSESAYTREILAEFGSEKVGLFRESDIKRAMKSYDLAALEVEGPRHGCVYALGIDWNGRKIGVHIVVTEYNQKTKRYRLACKRIIRNEQFTQISACEAIVQMFNYWRADIVYADFGAGEVQKELIIRHAVSSGNVKLAKAFKLIPMNSTVDIRNPASGLVEKKNSQQFAIDLLVHHMEQGLVDLPLTEDYIGNDAESEDMGIITQMKMFAVEKINQSGKPKYCGIDHTLAAFYLTILGLQVEKSQMSVARYDNTVVIQNSDAATQASKATGITVKQMMRDGDMNNFIPRELTGTGRGPNYGNTPTINAESVEWKNGIPMAKKNTGVSFNRNPGCRTLYKRKSF